ncbi:MAG: NAD(P)/FAD-dependent oxidoreductase [Comamonadaceae bacterium]|nr:MAG: NAD(P)/FAD-dependent oxidoreductase [Comamonadaceae bacterium]
MSTTTYDAVVIGAGAGGLCAAARLVAAGRKVLVVESRDRVGGRASSEQIEGFTVNVGAIAIERGGVFEETFGLLGVDLDIREPNPATVFRVEGKTINVAKGGWGMLLGSFTKQAAKIGAKFADARAGDLPEAKLTTEEWLAQYTKNETVHAIFRNLCAAIFAVNSNELPARAFLTYFAVKGAFKRFGFCPRGTVGLWDDLSGGIRSRGGEVWLNAPVTALHAQDGEVTAITVTKDGVAQRIEARTFISNIGPRATAALPGGEAFGAAYVEQTKQFLKPAANIVINFATQERLIDVPGLVTFGKTRRLCNMGELTATCPELAPAGWYLYVAYAVPIPALGDFDEATEIEASLQDLRDEFPGFAKAKMLSVRVMRGEWPAQRSCAGFDMPQDTPLANLWHVGDAVKDYGDGGTQACAYTGREAALKAVKLLDAVPA